MSAPAQRRRGPRADLPDARGAILRAARARFGELGYTGTRLRDVARDADVDVALIGYHFGGKDGLFAAAMALAVNPAELVEELVGGGADGLGERLRRAPLGGLPEPGRRNPMLALGRSAAGH